MEGLVFDIEEFALFDGPGIRCVVFLKGCPLRCQWCHNPEGLLAMPQRVKTLALCNHCGACDEICQNPSQCNACGQCVSICPTGALRIAGKKMTPKEVAAQLLRHEKLLQTNGGGITFSGGEPLMQPDFVIAVRDLCPGLHAAIETSGYAKEEDFIRVVRKMDLVMMDIKIMDPALHKDFTGVDNTLILQNLNNLKSLSIPFRIRVPLIPSINDTKENMSALALALKGAKALEKVELLPYNQAAGGKYAGLGMQYQPSFPTEKAPKLYTAAFKEAKIPWDLL